MKKDIHPPEVTDIAVAIVREENEQHELVWNVYLLNLKETEIEGVLVTSTGYGQIQDEVRRTSTLRHFLDTVPAKAFAKIEPIVEDVFGITNEYWVSFYINKVMYDKKYIFLPESISEVHFTSIPYLNKRGVMIR